MESSESWRLFFVGFRSDRFHDQLPNVPHLTSLSSSLTTSHDPPQPSPPLTPSLLHPFPPTKSSHHQIIAPPPNHLTSHLTPPIHPSTTPTHTPHPSTHPLTHPHMIILHYIYSSTCEVSKFLSLSTAEVIASLSAPLIWPNLMPCL